MSAPPLPCLRCAFQGQRWITKKKRKVKLCSKCAREIDPVKRGWKPVE